MRHPVCILFVLTTIAFAEDKPQFTNRLAKESSPYLLHHAHNPVDWYPWGDEAFTKAQRDGKLVFLSSGYHACHWCHVMERESFMNDEVAALLNEHFVCIKLDREERPEVDHVYMTALSAMGQNGGWPLSMFLTAEGKPIAGGTYWPREDREVNGQTIIGFKSVLKAVIQAQEQAAENLRKTAELRATQTRELLGGTPRIGKPAELNRDLITAAVKELEETFDDVHGGFGSPPAFRGPKFPRPPLLSLLQSEAARTKLKTLDDMLYATLERLARGGIYEQLGGGFHRYSTERTWTVPHFEKMLYDNAQLLEIYARAYHETKRPLYKRVIVETLAFVDREMASPEGVFYASLDADSDGEEGRFYVWNDAELAAVITKADDLAFLKKCYGADGKANFEDKYHIPVFDDAVTEADEQRLAPLKQRLLDARGKRPKPNLDTKVLTSWNGLMIAGMAAAGHAIDDTAAIERASSAADFLLKTMRTADGTLRHAYAAVPGEPPQARLNGCLDDYTDLVHGLLTLHDVTVEPRWLDAAKSLTATMVTQFHDADRGGFYFTTADHELLFARVKDQYDGVQPCGNSQAASNLVRLWQKTHDDQYRQLAEKTFQSFAANMQEEPRGLCAMVTALAEYLALRDAK